MAADTPSPDPSFEKYKFKVELFKWLIGSVALVVMTAIIDWGFKDRAAGMQEIQQYDKYATELIVMNNDPVRKRMLAQFFSNVTPSEKLRAGWESYYKEVDAEYREFLKKDTLDQEKLKTYMDKDTASLSPSQKIEKEQLEIRVKETQQIMKQPIILPNNSAVIPTVYIHFGSESQRASTQQLALKIIELGFKAPSIERVESAQKMASNEIRYFRETDENAVTMLQSMLQSQNIDVRIKPFFVLRNKTKEGTLELWLK